MYKISPPHDFFFWKPVIVKIHLILSKSWFAIVLSASCIIITSCTPNERQNSWDIEKTISVDESVTILAKALAKTIQREDARLTIRKLALEMRDADYDILLSWIEYEKMQNGENFIDVLLENIALTQSISVDEAKYFYLSLKDKVPNLHIAVRINEDQWDASSFIPLVACEKQNNRYEKDLVLAFDINGKEYFLSSAETPSHTTLVVGFNERVNEKGEVYPGFIYDNEIPVNTLRASGDMFGIRIIYTLVSWSDLDEGWLQSKAEYKFNLIAPKALTTPWEVWVDIPKSDVKNHKWTCALQNAFNWYFTTYGDFITIQAFEYDGGGSTQSQAFSYKDEETGITYTSTSTWQENDEKLGVLPVHKNDPDWQEYDTGIIKWYMKSTLPGGNTCN
ncbi:MAG: hypothetical protein SF052_21275 [Bacteroidia bacterium]|nr:hypothetical protein [Bacteroidia bacterium]